MKFEIKKLILEIEGEETEAFPITKKELEKEQIKDECDCGDDFCSSDGYLWVCSLGTNNKCQWYRTNTRCNP